MWTQYFPPKISIGKRSRIVFNSHLSSVYNLDNTNTFKHTATHTAVSMITLVVARVFFDSEEKTITMTRM